MRRRATAERAFERSEWRGRGVDGPPSSAPTALVRDRHPGHPRGRSRSGTSPRSAAFPIGGSAAPKTLIELLRQEVWRLHAPRLGHDRDVAAGSVCRPRSYTDSLPEEERYGIRAKQGAVVAGVDMRIVDELGAGPAVGRQERGRDPGARALGHQRLLQQSRAAPLSSPRTAGSAPATWPPSTPTATSRSPTGPRT